MVDVWKIIDGIVTISIPKDAIISQLQHEEDNELYQVWRIDANNSKYILKEAKGDEVQLYLTILNKFKTSVPTLYQIINYENKTYLLIEYLEGENLCKCNRTKLKLALDALITLQKETWEDQKLDITGDMFAKSLIHRQDRAKYLNDSMLEEAYKEFLKLYQALPKSLCHDDLLPFNIIASNQMAVLIDWECAGILPYPSSFARLIAHTENEQNALFYMTTEDKDFAINYFYNNLLKEKGISYTDWINTLDYFLFYEYCELVFIGNKYNNTDGEYYKKYLPMAKQQAIKILQKSINNF